MKKFKIAVLSGDGIGPEVVAQAMKVLDAVAHRHACQFEYCHALRGAVDQWPPAGVAVQFVFAGTAAGKSSEVLLPDPADEQTLTRLEELPVLKLARLIDTKLACGSGSPRRMHRDFADVVELIVVCNLGRDFAHHLHKPLRPTVRELVLRARGE